MGSSSNQVLIAVENLGSTTIALQAPSITGDFAVTASSCGSSLPADSSCAYGVTFTPTATGTRTGIFSISNGANTVTTQLSGQGLSNATDVLSPASLSFGATTVGGASAPQSVMLTNSGDGTLRGITVQAAGPFTASNNCGNTLGGRLSCAIAVTFTPQSAGASNGTLTVTDSIRTQTVALSGQGTLSSVASATPTNLDFGPYVLNGTAPAQVVTLNNPGSTALTDLAPSIVGGDFTIGSSSCGSTLAAGSSCTLNILFTPSATGTRQGVLTVTSSALATPLSVNLGGSGEDFTLSVSGSSSAVITSGQTANFSVIVTPVGSSAGTLTIACTGAPANSDCTTNPSTLNVPAGVTGDILVSLQTGADSNAMLAPSHRLPLDRLPNKGWAAAAVFALLMPVWLLRGSGRRRYLLMLSAVVLLGSSIACGVHASGAGAGGGNTLPGQTASGTYTLTITGSFPGAQRQATVQVVVQ